MERLELVERALQQIVFGGRTVADAGDFFICELALGVDFRIFGAVLFQLFDVCFELLEPTVEIEIAITFDQLQFFAEFGFEVGQVGLTTLRINPRHEVGGEVDHFFELFGLQFLFGFSAHEEIGQPGTGATEVPNVHDRGGQFDVAHALAPDLGPSDFNATTLAGDAAKTNALVFAAIALPVLLRTENLLAEEAVLFRTEGAVVDGFGLLDLAVGPSADGVGSGKADGDAIEIVNVKHGDCAPGS